MQETKPTTIKKGPFQAKVLENIEISPDIYRLKLENKEIAESALPGQFVSIKCKDLTLRRPFSVAKTYDNAFDIIYKVIGEGTQFMAELKPGNMADFIGPMGNSFNIEEKNSLLIGCGVGIAPIAYLSDILEVKGVEHSYTIGTKTALNINLKEYSEVVHSYPITEDGTCGLQGRLDHHLDKIIKERKPEKIYICGPNPAMICAVEAAKKHNIEIEVALERVFACGTGVCMGCVIQVMENGEQVQKRICKDGPVFDGRAIIWE